MPINISAIRSVLTYQLQSVFMVHEDP